jgi:prepilin-type N-terminal cleavage/methylation domain-containing protein
VLTKAAQRGYPLVELATAMTIIAILMMLGMPSFSEYINNARLGAVAQSFYAGLNQARSEAIRRRDLPGTGQTGPRQRACRARQAFSAARWRRRAIQPTRPIPIAISA